MCLYPTLRENKKWVPNKKNKGQPPIMKDPRTKWVATGCGNCMECRKQKARAWSVRLQEEIRTDKRGKFVTLTFSNKSIYRIINGLDTEGKKTSQPIKNLDGYELDNEIATIAVRRFLERWRKKHNVSVKHWLITELGQPDHKHRGTENIHLHGIIFTDNKEEIEKIWQYGFVYTGKFVNERTINYCVKYSTKIDEAHKEYKAKILASPGIGRGYINRIDAIDNKYQEGGKTRETYTTRSGQRINLPVYYRNKIYTEEEREQLWIEKLDKNERWVDGIKAKDETEYYLLLQTARDKNIRLGYGENNDNWQRKEYERQRRKMNMEKRLEKLAREEEE